MNIDPPPATRFSTPNRPPPPANCVCVVIWIELPIHESSPASEIIDSLASSTNSSTGMVVPVMRLCINSPGPNTCGTRSRFSAAAKYKWTQPPHYEVHVMVCINALHFSDLREPRWSDSTFARHSLGHLCAVTQESTRCPGRACGEMMLLTISAQSDGSGGEMRRDELMKPDMFSEAVLLIFGMAIFMALMFTLWLAVSHP